MVELHQRGVPWQWASRAVVLGTGVLTKLFLQGFQKVQVDGLDNFVQLVEGRAQRSLLTGKRIYLLMQKEENLDAQRAEQIS